VGRPGGPGWGGHPSVPSLRIRANWESEGRRLRKPHCHCHWHLLWVRQRAIPRGATADGSRRHPDRPVPTGRGSTAQPEAAATARGHTTFVYGRTLAGMGACGTAPTAGALPKCRLHCLLLQCPSKVVHGRKLMREGDVHDEQHKGTT
jgi:hypothetical protein